VHRMGLGEGDPREAAYEPSLRRCFFLGDSGITVALGACLHLFLICTLCENEVFVSLCIEVAIKLPILPPPQSMFNVPGL
jgi:hypothetical protein